MLVCNDHHRSSRFTAVCSFPQDCVTILSQLAFTCVAPWKAYGKHEDEILAGQSDFDVKAWAQYAGSGPIFSSCPRRALGAQTSLL